jgi:hypothetical protein
VARAVAPAVLAGLLALAPALARGGDSAALDPCEPLALATAERAAADPLPCPALAARPVGFVPRAVPPELASPPPRWRRRYALPALESLAVNAALLGFNRWALREDWAQVDLGTPLDNVGRSWVLDDDTYAVNQLGHPYQGGLTHGAARSAGLGFWTSAGYVVAASALWEIAAEIESPSLNDQVTTALGGVAMGEVLHRIAATLHAGGGSGRRLAAAALDPFQALNRRLVGAPPREAWPALRWSLGAGAVARDDLEAGETSVGGLLTARVEAGVPGDAALALRRPFDHFVLDAAVGVAADLQLTFRTRGLLAGEAFAAGAGGGLWGLFLSLDFDTPGPFRTAASGLGPGVSARVALPARLALEATALALVVPIGTAGVVTVPPGLFSRDYTLGPGASGLAEVALVAADRLRARLSFRPCAIAGVERGQPDVLVLDGGADLFVRVAGGHGLGAEVVGRRHVDRSPGGGVAHASGAVAQVYWATSGGALSLGP